MNYSDILRASSPSMDAHFQNSEKETSEATLAGMKAILQQVQMLNEKVEEISGNMNEKPLIKTLVQSAVLAPQSIEYTNYVWIKHLVNNATNPLWLMYGEKKFVLEKGMSIENVKVKAEDGSAIGLVNDGSNNDYRYNLVAEVY